MWNGVKNLWNFIRQQDSAIATVTKYAGMEECRYAEMEQRQRAKVKNQKAKLRTAYEAGLIKKKGGGGTTKNTKYI